MKMFFILLCCCFLLLVCNQKAVDDSKALFIEICDDGCETHFFVKNPSKMKKKSYINADIDSCQMARIKANADTITLDIDNEH
jgi:hypothetical protein